MADQVLEWVDVDSIATPIRLGSSIHIAEGIQGRFSPSMRFVTEQVPLQPGQRFRNVRHDEVMVSIPVVFSPASTSAGRILLRQWARRLDPVRGDGRLRITGPAGDTRELICRYASGLENLAEDFAFDMYGEARAVLKFIAEQPYWQDGVDTATSWTLGTLAPFFPFFPLRLSAAGPFIDASINNGGDVEAWPIWSIFGPATNPVLRNLTTGKLMSLTLTLVTSNDSLTIDTRPGVKTVTSNTGANQFAALSSGSSLWALVQGVNAIRLELASMTAAKLQLNWRRRYLTA